MRLGAFTLSILLFASAMFVGCNQEPQLTSTDVATRQWAEPTMTPGRDQPTQGQLEPFETNQGYGGFSDISLVISADHGYADPGDLVRIRFTAINVGDTSVTFESEDKSVMDILVRYQPGSQDVIRDWWSEGRDIAQEMKKLQLAPGESRSIEMTWIPPDIGYITSVNLFGVFRRNHRENKAHTALCVEDGCAEY